MAIKQREIETRNKLLQNPVRLKEIHKRLQEDLRLKESSSSSKKSKKSKKKKKKRSWSGSEDNSGTSDNDLDKILAKEYRKIKGDLSGEKRKRHGENGGKDRTREKDFSGDKIIKQKYETLSSQLDQMGKKKSKKKDRNRRNSSSDSGSESDENNTNQRSSRNNSKPINPFRRPANGSPRRNERQPPFASDRGRREYRSRSPRGDNRPNADERQWKRVEDRRPVEQFSRNQQRYNRGRDTQRYRNYNDRDRADRRDSHQQNYRRSNSLEARNQSRTNDYRRPNRLFDDSSSKQRQSTYNDSKRSPQPTRDWSPRKPSKRSNSRGARSRSPYHRNRIPSNERQKGRQDSSRDQKNRSPETSRRSKDDSKDRYQRSVEHSSEKERKGSHGPNKRRTLSRSRSISPNERKSRGTNDSSGRISKVKPEKVHESSVGKLSNTSPIKKSSTSSTTLPNIIKKTHRSPSSESNSSSTSSSSNSSSSSSSSSSNSNSSGSDSSDSANRQPPANRAYGLVSASGEKIELKAKPDDRRKTSQSSPRASSSKKATATFERPVKTKLTEEEKEKRLQEMQQNANWREKEREVNVKRSQNEAKREAENEKNSTFDRDYINKQMHKALSTNTSVEDRIKSNLNNIQRMGNTMNSSFLRK